MLSPTNPPGPDPPACAPATCTTVPQSAVIAPRPCCPPGPDQPAPLPRCCRCSWASCLCGCVSSTRTSCSRRSLTWAALTSGRWRTPRTSSTEALGRPVQVRCCSHVGGAAWLGRAARATSTASAEALCWCGAGWWCVARDHGSYGCWPCSWTGLCDGRTAVEWVAGGSRACDSPWWNGW